MIKDISSMNNEELNEYRSSLIKELQKVTSKQRINHLNGINIIEDERRYLVVVPFQGTVHVDVYAENEEMAKLKAYESVSIDFIEDEDISDISIGWYEDKGSEYSVIDYIKEFGE